MAQTAQININVNSQSANKTVDQLNQSISAAGGSAASLKAELRRTVQELQSLQPGTARFQELSLRAGELRDQIADTNAVVGQLAGNLAERLTRGITGVVSIGVAGFQTLAAGAALFGSENEELNKTLIRLNALMNLSQAIETFAGLDQKLIEIRASFQSLTVATEVNTVATAADAVATEGAAVATTAWGTAMKALPIIAIAAAIGTLVYGIYQYVSASGEADKNEKKRKANLEALKKAQDEQTETIAKESAEYVGLIYQLKATNAGSEERKTLIKDINATYGTTLKNLSDETAFQQQLNLEVANYITFQKAKFQLQKNEELVQKNLEKQATLQRELTKAEALYNAEFNIKLGQDDLYAGKREQNLRDYQASINRIKGELDAANKRLEAYGKVNLDVNETIKDVTNNGKKYTDQTKNNTTATKDNTDALEKQKAVLEGLKDVYERDAKAYKDYVDFFDKYGEGGGDSIFFAFFDDFGNFVEESSKEIVVTTAQYNRDLFDIAKKYTDQQRQLIDGAIQKDIEALDEKFVKQKISEDQYKKEREALVQKGFDKLTTYEKEYYKIIDDLRKEEEDKYKQDFEDKQTIAKAQTTLTQLEIQRIILDNEKKTALLSIENLTISEEEKAKKVLEVKNQYFAREIELIKKENAARIQLVEKQRDDELNNALLTTAEKEQIESKYNKEILDINTQTQDKIQALIEETTNVQKTQLEQIEDTINKVSDGLSAFQNVFSMFEESFTTYLEQQNQKRTTAIEDAYNLQLAALESNLAAGLIARESYDNQLEQLDQAQAQKKLALEREEFKKTKALNIVNATINGAQAVLSTFAGTPGGIVIKGIAAALAGIFAATQIALIARQEFTAADGGIVPGMGSGDIDSVPATLAPGEAVINSKSTEAFLPLLSAINEMGGGRSFVPDLPATNQGQRFAPIFVDNERSREPIRAYVVESDISSAQKRVNRIERSTRF
jgi:hypothetical protein